MEHILDELQEQAVMKCCDISTRLYCVTGPAGAGKTELIKTIHKKLTDAGHDVLLVAPTAAAARRIWKATGLPASTIHRALKFSSPGERDPKTGEYKGTSVPGYDKNNPMPYDVVIGDEYAMVNRVVHRALVSAMKPGALLRCFGDLNQLPPIEESDADKEAGSIFAELLRKSNGTILTKIYRQDGEYQDIIENCSRILQGITPKATKNYRIKFTGEDRPEVGPVYLLEQYVMECLENGIDFSKEENQIITPINRTWIGIHSLNTMLQRCFKDIGGDAYYPERHDWDKKAGYITALVVGDKVCNWKNNYGLNFFNGEGGYVKEIDHKDGTVVIQDEEREIVMPPYQEIVIRGQTIGFNPQKDLYLGYAKTTHKCQGNEFMHCSYILNKSAFYTVNRANFYTASSRPRRSFQLFTDQRTIWQAVNRVGEFKTQSKR